MKNERVSIFGMRHRPCLKGAEFSMQFCHMHECYEALLRGEAGADSTEWALWVLTRALDKDSVIFYQVAAKIVGIALRGKKPDGALGEAMKTIQAHLKEQITREELKQRLRGLCGIERGLVRALAVQSRMELWEVSFFAREDLFVNHNKTVTEGLQERLLFEQKVLEYLRVLGNPFEK